MPRVWTGSSAAAAVLVLSAAVGCSSDGQPPQPPPPTVDLGSSRRSIDTVKPLPPQQPDASPGFVDEPLVTQAPPEQGRYLTAYNAVGRPRVLVFVNRSVTGDLVPVNPTGPLVSVTDTQHADGPVRVESTATDNAAYNSYSRSTRSFDSTGNGTFTDRYDVYLRPGQYDEAQAKSIDYELIENLIADDLGAGGQVSLISPTMARQRLSDQDVKELQAGRPQMLGELAQKLNCDVLVQVTARPSRQTADGLGVRLVAEALNTNSGLSIAHAAVDVPPPLTKVRLNSYTRFIARKLMAGASGSWETMAKQPPMPPAPPSAPTPPPPPVPAAEPPPPPVVPRPTPPVTPTPAEPAVRPTTGPFTPGPP